jgi:cysteine desulfurase/selenocysteine lyase
MLYRGKHIREHFPILDQEIQGKKLVYLDNAATAQKPEQVLEAMDHYYKTTNANVHRGVHHLSQVATDAFENAREIVRNHLNAKRTEEIIVTKGTTDSINLVAFSYAERFLESGDIIFITQLDHHSNIVPWQMVAERKGAKIQYIPLLDDGTLDLHAFEQHLDGRCKLVAVNHVSNSLGTVNPIEEICRMSHAVGAHVLVDGAQSIPHMQVDVQALDVDFYAFSGHKAYGPTGVGILYGKKELLEELPPYQGGGEMISEVKMSGSTWTELPHKFEAGTPNIAEMIGLGEALLFLKEFGLENVSKIEQDLLSYATEKIEAIEGVRIYGTAENKASVISFLVEGIHPYDIGMILDKQGVAVRTGHHCTQPVMDHFGIPGTIRASFALYNTREEVDAFISALERALKMLR